MRLSVIIVHYRTPDLLEMALDALEPVLRRSDVECLVVDNGGDEAGEERWRRRLEGRRFRWLAPGRNLGYAGGVNLGVAESSGAFVVAMNPDVLVAEGCVEGLVMELERSADIVGPRLFWDQEERLLIPPAERRTRGDETLAALASRSRTAARWARSRWRRHARRHWRAQDAIESRHLPGALFAFRRAAFETVGELDPKYRLYFEETDWLRRAARAGLRCRYVPRSHAVHLYDQSAREESSSGRWFAESAKRFRSRHYGRLFALWLGWLEAPAAQIAERVEAAPERWIAPETESRSLWLELSPRSLGFPAVTERVHSGDRWSSPPSLERWHPGALLSARWVDDEGVELGLPFLLRVGGESATAKARRAG